MKKIKADVIRSGILAVLAIMLCMPPTVSAADISKPDSASADSLLTPQPAGLSTEGLPAEDAGTQPTAGATPWGAPVLLSPDNGAALYHYPRATTLIWAPVAGATSYKVERAYLSGSTWTAYSAVTVAGFANSSYTFNFVGDQPGRWRVTAINGTSYSSPSAWWTFSYKTKPIMGTPILTNPAANEVFDHFCANEIGILK